MKFATVLMSVLFAGVLAQANEGAAPVEQKQEVKQEASVKTEKVVKKHKHEKKEKSEKSAQ